MPVTELSMPRLIAGAFIGSLAARLLVAGSMAGLQHWLGNDRIFLPGSYDYSSTLILLSIAVTLVSALIGGAACVFIAGARRAGHFCAGIVLILGISSAASALRAPEPGPRPATITAVEAARHSRPPAWLTIVTPVLTAAGVLAGSQLRRA